MDGGSRGNLKRYGDTPTIKEKKESFCSECRTTANEVLKNEDQIDLLIHHRVTEDTEDDSVLARRFYKVGGPLEISETIQLSKYQLISLTHSLAGHVWVRRRLISRGGRDKGRPLVVVGGAGH